MAGVIVIGLAFDQTVEFWGQALTNIAVWALFLYWLSRAASEEQVALTACVVYATLGEIFLSLMWGLYDYRLGNIPLFVPPGHALLFVLGRQLALRLSMHIVAFVPLAAAPFVLWLAMSGTDTLGVPLFAMFVACLVFGEAKRLYAVMFVLALAMELYGTWWGNWAWNADVPWLGLTAANPPLAAGAFYCVLDLLVMSTVRAWRARAIVRPRSQTTRGKDFFGLHERVLHVRPSAIPSGLGKHLADLPLGHPGIQRVADVAPELAHVLLAHQHRQNEHHALLHVER
jgi:hypothetical protein